MNMLRLLIVNLFLGIVMLFAGSACASSGGQSIEQETAQVLIFSKTEGFRHSSIPDGVKAVKELIQERGLAPVHTENSAYFRADSLSQFQLVIFLNTTGDVLNETQQSAFEQYIQSGGGFLGIHSATDTEYEWPWYGQLVGAYFDSHPRVQEASISLVDANHSATSFLPDEWIRRDEWYNYRNINPQVNILLNLEESSYEGGTNGDQHPIAWYHEYEGGRVFYTGGGHTSESYEEPLFRRHLGAAIDYVRGEPIN